MIVPRETPTPLELAIVRLVRSAAANRRAEDLERRRRLVVVDGKREKGEAA